jgi:hypothetical protein
MVNRNIKALSVNVPAAGAAVIRAEAGTLVLNSPIVVLMVAVKPLTATGAAR